MLQANSATAWSVLLLCAPLVLAIPKGGAVLLAALLLVYVATKSVSRPDYGTAARIALWLTVAMFAWHVLVSFLQGHSLRDVGPPSRLLFLPLVAYIAATRPLSVTALGCGFFLLAAVEVAVMAWQLAFLDPAALQRAEGTTGRQLVSAAFAWVAALVVLATVRSAPLSSALKALIGISVMLLAVTAIALAGARGVAVAVPVAMLVLAILNRKPGLALLGVGLFAFLMLLPGVLGDRMLSGVPTELAELERGNASTSVGARAEMWRVAFDLLAANPWVGAGAEGYKSAMAAKLAAGEVSIGAARWGEPHNDYLMFGAFYGLPSLVLFLLLMGFLIAAFMKVAREAGQTERGHVAIAGIGMVVSYLVFCATSSFFAAQSPTTFFVFFAGLLLGICYRSEPAARA